MSAFVSKLKGWVDQFPEATAIAVVNNELKAATAAINQTFGTTLSAPQFQATAVTPLSTSPPLTAEDVVTFGTGVEFSALEPELVEAAAVLAPESEAAKFIAALVTPAAPAVDVPIRIDPPVLPVVAPRVVADLPLIDVLSPRLPVTMPMFHPDPFISSGHTGLPTFGGPGQDTGTKIFGIPIGDIVREGIDILGGQPISDSLRDLLGGQPLLPTTPTAPTVGTTTANGDIIKLLTDLLLELSPFGETAATYRLVTALLSSLTGETSQFGGPTFPNGLPPPTTGVNGCAVPAAVTAPFIANVMRAPKGYVLVTCNGQRVAMLKEIAVKMGYWKRRRKPPMSASEWKTLTTAKRVMKKSKRIAETAGFRCSTSSSRRRSTSAHKCK